jgi:two-component system, OmpR family, phosphate regulon response regulator PhoB
MAHIAVVDDDDEFLTLLREMLELEEWKVATYRESTVALEALKANRPDLIILDLRIDTPDAGWRLLDGLLGDEAMQTIPVIVCSAASRELDEKQAFLTELGISTLEKPFDIDVLYNCVRAALARAREYVGSTA